MFENFAGSVILEFIGAFTRWSLYALKNRLKGEKTKSFGEVWDGGKGKNDSDLFFHGLSNIFVGFLVLILLIGIGFLINAIWY